MNAMLVHIGGLDEFGDTLMRQIVMPDGDREMVLSTDWSKATISRVFRQNTQDARRIVRELEVPPELIRTVRAFLRAKDDINGCLQHFNSLLCGE